MMRLKTVRTVAAIAGFGLVAVACGSGGDDGSENGENSGPKASNKPFNYNTAMAEDVDTDNYWAYQNEADVYSAYALQDTKCGLYQTEYPSPSFVPDLATKDFEEVTPTENDDGTWSVEATLQDGAVWSDGEPITAEDFEFTFDTVKDFELTTNWAAAWIPVDKDSKTTGTMNVEAVDDTTVRFTFNKEPGMAVWPIAVGGAPIMAQHHWQDMVDKAAKTDNPAATLTAESGEGDPSCGPVKFGEREKGSFITVEANDKWHQTGRKVTTYEGGGAKIVHEKEGLDGVYGGPGKGKETASHKVGPYLKKETIQIFSEPNAAILGLEEGEADFFYNSLGLEKGLRERAQNAEELEVVSNQQNGMRYLAFDHRKQPTGDRAFRQAVATLIDKEELTSEVLGGDAYPLPTALPPGNTAWYDEKKAEQAAAKYQDFENRAERVEAAVKILEDAGYSWEQKPSVNGNKVKAGSGLMLPNGDKVPELEFQHPTQGYDRMRYIAAKSIEKWTNQIGIPVKSNPIEFQQLVDNSENPKARVPMWLLGFSFGTPVFPDHYDSFWQTDGSWNRSSYSSEEYDQTVAKFMGASDLDEAKKVLWDEVVPLRQRDVPWVVLFGTPVSDVYRGDSVTYPYTTTLSGIQYINGMKGGVKAVE